jgi:predicted alpha/beta superfamily hydrolase
MKTLFFLIMLWPAVALTQVRLSVSIPAETPPNDTIFLAGSVNNWNPSSSEWALTRSNNNRWSIFLPELKSPVEFKFTRGSWSRTEADAEGMYIPNRLYVPGHDTVVELSVLGWEDQKKKAHSASPNVSIVNDSFFIPQLNRYRRIWIYLPPGYNESIAAYPVMYMCDGQNLFDDATSYIGEWAVDEMLNQHAAEGKPVPIVVGIDHGVDYRMREYSPWTNAHYGEGEGEAFMQFLCSDLKPFIDSNYRTLTGREHTALTGASMGGLIALYGVLAHSDIIGAAGVFSPSLWINDSVFDVNSYSKSNKDVKIFLLVGGKEGHMQARHISRLRKALKKADVAEKSLMYMVDPEAGHNELLWKAHFIESVLYLFPSTRP